MSSSAQETTRVCLACGLATQDEITNCPNDGSLLAAGADPLVGTTFLDKYQITEVLGRGGMSAVYKARHLLMDRHVAIKFLRSELVHDNVMLQRFQLESKAVSLLKHPNIITVHDFGLSPQGVPYLIMDFLEGKTVSDIVAEEEHIQPARCIALFTQICNALAHTHNKGVIHRDIKPSNLIVSINDEGQEIAQVVDFGIAKMLEREASDASKLTASGEVFGSPAYMSPEQCNGSSIDARTDIYALACVIYNCLTGRPPLLGRNAMETVMMHVRDMPKTFREMRPDLTISPALERVVFKALAKNPDERFSSMSEFGAELAKSMLVADPGGKPHTSSSILQKTLQEHEMMDNYDRTMPLSSVPNLAPNATPNAGVPVQSNRTQNLQPDAIQPSADLGKADPVVSLKETSPHSNSNEPGGEGDVARGRMNPNAMIMPGSDLFGYESLKPAVSDHLVTGGNSGSNADPPQHPSPAASTAFASSQSSPPKPTRIVDDIPLAAPPRSPLHINPQSQTNSQALTNSQLQTNSQALTNSQSQTRPQPTHSQSQYQLQSNSQMQNQSPQQLQTPSESNPQRLILILGVVLAVLVIAAVILFAIRAQGG
ncbi:MAG TPA: protein kinase [Drouetiella sp.]|jgi:serine/threonine protein kinase